MGTRETITFQNNMADVAKFLFILIRDRKYKWVKMYKVNWFNPLSWIYVPFMFLFYLITK